MHIFLYFLQIDRFPSGDPVRSFAENVLADQCGHIPVDVDYNFPL